MACVNVAQVRVTDNSFPRLQAHLVPSCDCKEGSGCAFFLCYKTQRCSSPPSLHRGQLFSDDPLGLFHQPEIGPAALSQRGLWHWHRAVGIASGVMALERLLQMKRPVCRNSATRPPRTQAQHGFGTCEPPVCPGHCHAILDQKPAGPFNPPGRHGTTRGEIGIVMPAVGILAQRMRPRLDGGALGFWRAGRRGTAPETRGHRCAAAAPHFRKACAPTNLSEP